MRRGFASMLMGLSLILASAGWAGTVFAGSVLDTDNAGVLASRLMNRDAVHSVLVTRLAEGMERHVPVDEPLSRQDLRAAATDATADPEARAALHQALTDAHLLGLAGEASDAVFDDMAVNEAARQALIATEPSLQGRILANPLVKVELPVGGLTWFSGLKSMVDRFAVLALALGAVGFATTFVVAAEPAVVLRRASWWILGSALCWLVVGPILSGIARVTVPSSYVLFASSLEVFLDSMRNPATVMASFGIGMLSVSFLAPAYRRRRGALLLDRAKHRLSGSENLPTGLDSASCSDEAISELEADRATVSASGNTAEVGLSASRAAGETSPTAASSSTMTVERGSTVASRLSAAWLEGHGYLDDSRIAPFITGSTPET